VRRVQVRHQHQQLPLPSQQEKLRGCASGEGQGSAWDDFYHLYDAKLNRCVFNDSQGHDCVFFKKKMGPNYRYKKCTGRGLVWYKKLVPGTKVLFSCFVTDGRLQSRNGERCTFC
jgi:hypothetical protein